MSAARTNVNMTTMYSLSKLSASRSRTEFFRHLGWQEDNEDHKRMYTAMMDEAARGRERVCDNVDNLVPQSRGSSPPYSASMITETAKHREIQRIFNLAGPETLEIYKMGMTAEGSNWDNWDNWIIRWCLWHVFRYRDDRNRNRGSSGSARVIATSAYAQPMMAHYGYAARPYDPVREAAQQSTGYY